ncbi:MAG: hypothetical protein FWE50_00065 [Alphaproteobacteria bacterium]|nr:hypothetical protein [Alphaproteobacteria bacterium]
MNKLLKNLSRFALVAAVTTPFAAAHAILGDDEIVTSKEYVDSGLGKKANKTDVTTSLAGKQNNITGTANQVVMATGTAGVVDYRAITGSVTSDSTALVTSGGVYSALDSFVSGSISGLGLGQLSTMNVSDLGALAMKDTVATSDIDDGAVTTGKLTSGIVTSLGKADTALQTGNNVSLLTNDAGYITSAALSGYATTGYVDGAVATETERAMTAESGLNTTISGINTELINTNTSLSNVSTSVGEMATALTGLNETVTGINTHLMDKSAQVDTINETLWGSDDGWLPNSYNSNGRIGDLLDEKQDKLNCTEGQIIQYGSDGPVCATVYVGTYTGG